MTDLDLPAVTTHPLPTTNRWAGRARTAEAMSLLAIGGAFQRWVPLRRWSRVLGEPVAVPTAWAGHAVGDPVAGGGPGAPTSEHVVRAAVSRGSRRLPWHATCLAEAFAGQVMLRRRGRAGVVVIGLRRTDSTWDAHAWLLGASGVLTGGRAARGFTATSVFEVRGGVRAEGLAAAGPAH